MADPAVGDRQVASLVIHMGPEVRPSSAVPPNLAAVAPRLESLDLRYALGAAYPYPARWLGTALASTTRLTRLVLGAPRGTVIIGPPGMLSTGREAVAAFAPALGDSHTGLIQTRGWGIPTDLLAALDQGVTTAAAGATAAAAAAAPALRPVQLTKLSYLGLDSTGVGEAPGPGRRLPAGTEVRAGLEAAGATRLTFLHVFTRAPIDADFPARLAAAISAGGGGGGGGAGLTLQELVIQESVASAAPVDFDLRDVGVGVGLSRLVIKVEGFKEACRVQFSPTLAAGLHVLALSPCRGYAPVPPRCATGAFDRLASLTRLVYSATTGPQWQGGQPGLPANLAGWATRGYSLPVLEHLEVWGDRFTVDFIIPEVGGEGGQGVNNWAARLLELQPRLGRVVLVCTLPRTHPLSEFSCRMTHASFWDPEGPARRAAIRRRAGGRRRGPDEVFDEVHRCPQCETMCACDSANAVGDAVNNLPAAVPGRGVSLEIVEAVGQHGRRPEWEDEDCGHVVLGYAPVGQ